MEEMLFSIILCAQRIASDESIGKAASVNKRLYTVFGKRLVNYFMTSVSRLLREDT